MPPSATVNGLNSLSISVFSDRETDDASKIANGEDIWLNVELDDVRDSYVFTLENDENNEMPHKITFELDYRNADALCGFLNYCRELRKEA